MATTRNKVMWQEGMLMRPHHFQQQQRYNDYLDNQRFRAMNDLSWGFTELTLNNELLADAPRDKRTYFREINYIAAAFQYQKKNYNSA
ncbi:type VI secretion system baseplate subunit TssK [Escherichia coli]|nr:type VI secretion system baseplate subunit TssK [Escherichia coli]TJA30666.1 hypothetical protein C9313_23735 [Escherichia coli]